MNATAAARATTKEGDGVVEYLPLVRYVVSKVASRNWNLFEQEDLVSYGVIGLLEAKKRYQPELGPFASFAIPRIRGAIIDAMRSNDFLSRQMRKDVRMVGEAELELQAFTGETSSAALEETLGMSHGRVVAARRASQIQVVPLESLTGTDETGMSLAERIPDDAESALDLFLAKELVDEVTGLVEELPERERIVLSLHFLEGLTMKEIASVLSISESRVSQLQARAIYRLRVRLQLTTVGKRTG